MITIHRCNLEFPTMKKILSLCLLIALSALVAPTAKADDAKEDAIKARQGYYQVVRLNAGILVAMVKGEAPYDAAKAKAAADNLMIMTSLNKDAFWIPGTSKEELPGKTRALKKIWDSYPAIGEKAKAYKEAVTAVAGAVDDGLDGLKKTIPALGKSCKACHEEYRAEKF